MSDSHTTRDRVFPALCSSVTPHLEHVRSERILSYEPGIYVDLVSGQPLFASSDRYESRTQRLNFTRPIDPANISEVHNTSHGMIRTEVRSAHTQSHLGHLFSDGPVDRGGLRYRIHPASVRFIPRELMAAEGYGDYLEHL